MTVEMTTRSFEIVTFPSDAEMEASWKTQHSDKPFEVTFRLKTPAGLTITLSGVIISHQQIGESVHVAFRANPQSMWARGVFRGEIDLSGATLNTLHQQYIQA